MSKDKPRHNPNKSQNKYGAKCPYVEEIKINGNVELHCEIGIGNIKVCKGNKHNCVKTYLHKEASKSDAQKINDSRRNKNE